MIRTGDYKYVYHTPADEAHPAQRELYNLKTDPGEFDNLANEPAQRQRVKTMHAALVAELGEHPDNVELRFRADGAKRYDRPDLKKKKKNTGRKT